MRHLKPSNVFKVLGFTTILALSGTVATTVLADDVAEGNALMKGSDCMSCHRVPTRLIGPSYKEVAEKYKGADDAKITELAQKIIKGGAGVWGTVPMTPHPNVSEADAKKMVIAILSVGGGTAAAATPATTTQPGATTPAATTPQAGTATQPGTTSQTGATTQSGTTSMTTPAATSQPLAWYSWQRYVPSVAMAYQQQQGTAKTADTSLDNGTAEQ